MLPRWVLLCLLIIASLLAMSNWPARSDTGSQKPFGIEKRVKWTTSRLVGSPDPPRKYRLTRAFDRVVFKEPVFIAQDPESDPFMVAEDTPGKTYRFRP